MWKHLLETSFDAPQSSSFIRRCEIGNANNVNCVPLSPSAFRHSRNLTHIPTCQVYTQQFLIRYRRIWFPLCLYPFQFVKHSQINSKITMLLCIGVCNGVLRISIAYFVGLSVYLSVCLSVCLSLFLSVCLSVCLSVYLSVSQFDCTSDIRFVRLSVCLTRLTFFVLSKNITLSIHSLKRRKWEFALGLSKINWMCFLKKSIGRL